MEQRDLSKELKLQGLVEEYCMSNNIIYKSEKMRKVLDKVELAALSDSNVYIEGESGTGKELIAKLLHKASSRKDKPFVAINCAAIPETLIESELFGYEKGAFTNASNGKIGLFQQAHKGTFFFDELSEMPMTMQAKLLRVFQNKEFYKLGSSKTTEVDIRLLSSSNKNLEDLIQKGLFREDLFYRISVILIKLPPLRERKEDIPLLSRHFLKKFASEMNKEKMSFSHQAIQKMRLYSWPGNVRELENTVESSIVMATQNIITEDLVIQAQHSRMQQLKPLKGAKNDFERNYLIELLEFTKGNVAQAAELAGKYRADLYELLKKHGLSPSQFRNN